MSNMESLAITDILSLVKSMMGLFSEFPLNLLLTGSVAVIGFEIFSQAKNAAR